MRIHLNKGTHALTDNEHAATNEYISQLQEETTSERRDCTLCHVPLGSATCGHIWEHDGEVTMARNEWHKLLATSDRFRKAVIQLDSEGYEAGEYD